MAITMLIRPGISRLAMETSTVYLINRGNAGASAALTMMIPIKRKIVSYKDIQTYKAVLMSVDQRSFHSWFLGSLELGLLS